MVRVTEEQSERFGSCSYRELTACVKARIEWIREIQDFAKNTNIRNYGHIRFTLKLKGISYKRDIQALLHIRRMLKRYNLRCWHQYNKIAVQNKVIADLHDELREKNDQIEDLQATLRAKCSHGNADRIQKEPEVWQCIDCDYTWEEPY